MKLASSTSAHKARKRFGQHFLTDNLIIERIIRSINPQATEHIVEIGPGLGAITRALLDCGCKLDLIELDRDLVPKLRKKFSAWIDSGALTIHQADALRFDYVKIGADKMRLVGNLPYNISTPLMFHLFQFSHSVEDMHFMLQKEVALRLSASPGSKTYGRLSVMAQCYCNINTLFEVPSQAFSPAPRVQSAIVRLQPSAQQISQVLEVKVLQKVLSTAFNQRRKTLANSLRTLECQDILQTLAINPKLRPEQISLQQYVQLANQISVRDNIALPKMRAAI